MRNYIRRRRSFSCFKSQTHLNGFNDILSWSILPILNFCFNAARNLINNVFGDFWRKHIGICYCVVGGAELSPFLGRHYAVSLGRSKNQLY